MTETVRRPTRQQAAVLAALDEVQEFMSAQHLQKRLRLDLRLASGDKSAPTGRRNIQATAPRATAACAGEIRQAFALAVRTGCRPTPKVSGLSAAKVRCTVELEG